MDTIDDREKFRKQVDDEIRAMGDNAALRAASNEWMDRSIEAKYSYHFKWLGLPIIQYPQDMIAMQELIWEVKPDLVIETGVARGGSLVFYASLLNLLGRDGQVLGIDIDIRPHNRQAIESHPLANRISLIEGSSIDGEVVAQVAGAASGKQTLVVLDSNHTHDHVLAELSLYSPLVRSGSYLVVFDTVIDSLDPGYFHNRPWGRGDNSKTAVDVFLRQNPRFRLDHAIDAKLQLSVAPSGYLRCISDI